MAEEYTTLDKALFYFDYHRPWIRLRMELPNVYCPKLRTYVHAIDAYYADRSDDNAQAVVEAYNAYDVREVLE